MLAFPAFSGIWNLMQKSTASLTHIDTHNTKAEVFIPVGPVKPVRDLDPPSVRSSVVDKLRWPSAA